MSIDKHKRKKMLSKEEVLHIAILARLAVDEAEIEKSRQQLSNIIENFEVLKQVDTTGVPPTTQSISLQNVLKDDAEIPSLPANQVLANAPHQKGEFFKIKAVLEE